MPFVGKADPVTKPVQDRVGLQVGDIDNQAAARLDDSRQLSHKALIVRNVFQEVYDNDLIERGVGERRGDAV